MTENQSIMTEAEFLEGLRTLDQEKAEREADNTAAPDRSQTTNDRHQKPSRRRRAEKVKLRYNETMTRLRTTDSDAYWAVSSRIVSYKTMADKWRDRATIAESRLAVLEAHISIQNAKETNK